MKKILALLVAALLALSMVSAFAATGDQLATAESTISATGVEAGDTVKAYQLVQWVNGDWALTTLGDSCGVTLPNLVDGITEAEATTIANALATATETYTLTESEGTWTKTDAAAGMYYLKAIANANHADIIYNPAFVSADYKEGGNTVDFSSNIGSSAVVKKSSVPFEKKVNDADQTKYVDVKPGDVIPYIITTTIPSYGTTFTNPKFTITDTLSTGLTLDDTITVKCGTKTWTATTANEVTITKGTPANGFTVDFDKAFLTALAGDRAVEITYSATVSTEALDNVTYMDNKAKLTFSNTPTTTSDKEDLTRHYTFSIDGNLLGSTEDQTDELIKVACDANGNPIYDQKTTYYDKPVNPLDGATFTLTAVTGSMKAPSPRTVSSSNGGHIQFLGLDAGTYELVEDAAPAGYVKDGQTYVVEIVPTYDNSNVNDPILTSYDVKFYLKKDSGNELLTTSTFSTTNDGTKVTRATHAEHAQTIGNTPGTELPSTGGVGTTLLYIGGSILVLAAVILLVTKRRMKVED